MQFHPITSLESSSFLCYLEHVTTISNPEYSNMSIYASDLVFVIPTKSSSSHNLECFTSSSSSHNFDHFTLSSLSHNLNILLRRLVLNALIHYNLENFTSLSDNLNDSVSSNTLLQNTKKHKLVFVASSTKKPKPRKSWVWDHMRKDKTITKETKCLVLVERNRKIVSCGELFALTSSMSTLGAHLHMIYRLFEKGSFISVRSELLARSKYLAGVILVYCILP
ncbi:hypothetical protein F8M41_003415 [Gigaspora margarita]|uniref:Uncharacterized protein n=1 Tax=Gigaspora margarita TaxID=4874 RepID=A0A8H4EVH4_GIGMA|nr:hypothetical protein F8M41_003415 [Gigaspora margarita]